MFKFFFSLFILLSFYADAQMPEKIMSFPFYNGGSYSGGNDKQIVEVNDFLLFVAHDGIHGPELWRSDGTEESTTLVKDIYPGNESSYISDLTRVGDKVFFIAKTPEKGPELWKSDGTTEGTQIVKDIVEGPMSPYYFSLTEANGLLFFIERGSNAKLWRSDGTAAGTFPIQENVLENSLASAWGELIFVQGSSSNYDLVRTDGETTTVIANFESPPINFFFDGKSLLYFNAYVGAEGYAKWRTDGTPEGTIILQEESRGGRYVTFQGQTYFPMDGYLCKTDGTPEGTIKITEIPSPFSDLIATDQYIIFSVYQDEDRTSIWRSDGTATGTLQLKDSLGICQFKCTILNRNAKLDNIILFSVSDQEGKEVLWKTDGTLEGTITVKTIREIYDLDYMTTPTRFKDALYFFTDNGIHGFELWRSDGTETGTFMVKDINQQILSNTIGNVTKANDSTFYFSVEYSYNKIELWKSNGTKQGTVKVANLPGRVYNFSLIKDTLYFQDQRSLWKSNGTAEGTKRILMGGLHETHNLSDLIAFKDMLIFSLSTSSFTSSELMMIDPAISDTITTRLSRLDTGADNLTIVEDKLFFAGTNNEYGKELWVTDGTKEGTKMVKDIKRGYYPSNPSSLIGLGNQCVFTAYDGQGNNHWISDGTSEGTKPLSWTSKPYVGYFSSGDILYLSIWNEDSSAYELWKSNDGQSLTLVKQIKVSDREERIYLLAGQDSISYFTVGICKLWKTNGTKEGTVPVKNIKEADKCISINFSYALFVDNQLYFHAVDSGRYHLWVTDGTDSGTYKLSEVNRYYPTLYGQATNDMVNIGDYLLFAHNEDSVHDALYRLQIRESEIPANVAPTISGVQSPLQVNENDSIAIDLENFLVEDPDHNFPEDFSMIIKEGEHYSISHLVVYPEQGFSGELTVPVQVSDGQDSSKVYRLIITVLPVNEKPVIKGVANIPEVSSGEEIRLTLDNFLVEDGDNDYPDNFTLAVLEGENYTIQDNLVIIDSNFTGELSIPVKVNDGRADSEIFMLRLIVQNVTGLANSNSEANGLRIVPNPIDNTALELQNHWTGNVEYKVVDTAGRPVKEGSFLKKSYLIRKFIDFNGLHSGVYYLLLNCNGQSLQTKIVVP